MRYDYLIVGTGLFGAVFAHEAAAAGKNACALTEESIWEEIFIQRKKKGFRYTNTAPISSIPPTKNMGLCKSICGI